MKWNVTHRSLLYFVVYSFLGWIIDTSFRSALAGQYAPGSFSPLPFTPIYGFGALLILLIGKELRKTPWFVQFFAYSAAATTLEYVGAITTQLLYHRRLWDYTQAPFNLNGDIDIFHTVAWGILGLFLVQILHPRIARLLV